MGFAGNTTDQSALGGLPFFQNLCHEKEVKECHFGLAFGADGTGDEILGGVNEELFEGNLSHFDADPDWYYFGNVIAKGAVLC